MIQLYRAFDAKLEVSEGERAVVAKVNTGCVDRYGTVICPEGVDLAAYRQNPVVLVNHGQSHDGIPIGRCAWIKYSKAESALISKTIFDEDEFSDGLFRKAQAGTMRSFSVRVLPVVAECSAPTAQELRKQPDLADCWLMVRKCELVEYSIVSVPGNPEALALAVSRGLVLPDRLRAEMGAMRGLPADEPPIPEPEHSTELPALVGRSFGEIHSSLTRRLRETLAPGDAARKAAADAVDLLRGRI